MRTLYFGLPLGALVLLRNQIPLCGVAVGHPNAPGMNRLRSRYPGLLLAKPNLDRPEVQRALLSTRPDLILSWFWPRLIPDAITQAPRLGAFGVHPSLLPRHRGPDPYFWTIRRGDTQTGVTLHRLRIPYDTGAIAAQIPVTVPSDATGGSLAKRVDRPSLSLLTMAAMHLRDGGRFRERPQSEHGHTLASQPTDEELVIDWLEPTEEILQLIRAARPYPLATASLGATVVEVRRARAAPKTPALIPGEARLTDLGPEVQTKDGALLLEEVRADSWLRGPAINDLVPKVV